MSFNGFIYSNSGNIVKSPCTKECPDRNATCHPKCKKYLAYIKEKDKKNAEIYKQKQQMYNLNSREVEASRRAKKSKNLTK